MKEIRNLLQSWKNDKTSLEIISTQQSGKIANDILNDNKFESVSTQISWKCGEEMIMENNFESVSTQNMMMCGEEMWFHVKYSMNIGLKKFIDDHIL